MEIKYVPNYHINLLDINQLQDISQYKTDLQVVFGMLKCRQDKKKVKKYVQENAEYFQHMDIDTYNVLRVLLKAEKQLEIIKEKGKEEIDMCEALQGIFDDGVELGIKQGIDKDYRWQNKFFDCGERAEMRKKLQNSAISVYRK